MSASSNPYIDALDQHLRELISELTNGTTAVTRWAIVYEISNGDVRLIQTTASEGVALQDLAGMFTWALEEVRRGMHTVMAAGEN